MDYRKYDYLPETMEQSQIESLVKELLEIDISKGDIVDISDRLLDLCGKQGNNYQPFTVSTLDIIVNFILLFLLY